MEDSTRTWGQRLGLTRIPDVGWTDRPWKDHVVCGAAQGAVWAYMVGNVQAYLGAQSTGFAFEQAL